MAVGAFAMHAAKRSPWVRAAFAAAWLFSRARDRLERNLSSSERSRLWELLRKSKGRRSSLSSRERRRMRALTRKAIRGS
jgi:hypothetical protein